MVQSAALAVLIVVVGMGLTLWADVPLRLEERLPIGLVTGVVAVSAASFLGFELVGMGWGTLAGGLGLPGLAAAGGWARHRGVLGRELRRAGSRLRRPASHPSSLRPLGAFAVVTTAVATRILALAYQTTGAGLSAGSLAIWGDWAAHLAYAGSFAYGDNRALELPIASGEPLRYHFFADYVGSLFTVTGLELHRSLVLATWMLAVAFPLLLFGFTRRLTGSRLTAGLSVVLFTLTGGVGAFYFLSDVQEGGWRILTTLPQTYARMPDEHLWVDNTISASLYAQRSTQLGMTIALAAALLIVASRPRWARSGFLVAGLLVGVTGIAHVHTLVTALALGGIAWLFDRRAAWMWFLLPASVIGLPLALAISPPTNSLRWHPGWMAPLSGEVWPWFWIRNVGLLLPLFLAITLLGGVPKRLRRLSAPLWLWFIVPNVIAFHPWDWNNTKFFLFWQLAACVVIADFLRRAFTGPPTRRPAARATASTLGVLALIALTVTGGLDTLRAMQTTTAIPWVDADEVAAARWLRKDADEGDTLVYGSTNTSAVAALSGVPAVLGYPGWVDDLGLPDWRKREIASQVILRGTEPDTAEAVERYGVDYVVIGPRERFEVDASDEYWDDHGQLVFSQGDYRIYEV